MYTGTPDGIVAAYQDMITSIHKWPALRWSMGATLYEFLGHLIEMLNNGVVLVHYISCIDIYIVYRCRINDGTIGRLRRTRNRAICTTSRASGGNPVSMSPTGSNPDR